MSLTYSKSDFNSILNYAKNLKNKSLREVCGEQATYNSYKGKGNFGQILEKFYFHYDPNSISEPDFNEVGIELKSSPLKRGKKNHLSAKERLVLSIINYEDIVNQEFKSSSFLNKSQHLLLIFYLYEKNVEVIDDVTKEYNHPD